MGKKLFCGGLAWGTNDESLRGACAPFGEVVDARVVMDRETGKSRGFGFVTFATDEAAEAARKALDGAQLDGRQIRVNEADDRPGGGGGWDDDSPRRKPRGGGGGRRREGGWGDDGGDDW
jgi:RNA recognition motif-containing protein